MKINKTVFNYTEDDLHRANLQLYLSSILKSFPNISLEVKSNLLIQKTEYIKRKLLPNNKKKINNLLELLNHDIIFMHSYDYVHGDILTKNIVYDGNIFRLIDHELRLVDKEIFNVTFPWVSIEDLKLNLISKKTDEICFKATKLKLLDKGEYINFRLQQTEKLKINNVNYFIKKINY